MRSTRDERRKVQRMLDRKERRGLRLSDDQREAEARKLERRLARAREDRG